VSAENRNRPAPQDPKVRLDRPAQLALGASAARLECRALGVSAENRGRPDLQGQSELLMSALSKSRAWAGHAILPRREVVGRGGTKQGLIRDERPDGS
jgi:hypothetical protein